MDYAFQPGEAFADAAMRIAREETEAASAHLAAEHVDAKAVHEVRKHMKKMRGLLRLVRNPLGQEYSVANAICRDTARQLSGVRDADVMLETLDWVARSGRPIDAALLRKCEDYLQQHRDEVRVASGDIQDNIEAARQGLRELSEHIESWQLPEQDSKLIRKGLKRLYKQSRDLYHFSMLQPTEEHFHDWRKRVKYHWYHCRLLEPLAPDFLKQRTSSLKSLSDVIGHEHDLAVLREFLSRAQGGVINEVEMLDILEIIVILQSQQREQAWHLGGELFAQPPRNWSRQCLKSLQTET